MGDAIDTAIEVGISYRRGYLDGFRDGSAARAYAPKPFDVDAYAKHQFRLEEPAASMRVDFLDQTRELMRAYYHAIERELEHHAGRGRAVDQCVVPPHGSLLCGVRVSVMLEGADTTLSIICIEVDSIDTPVMRVVVQRRVP